ncbi:MAG: U32 family peptidase [Veillonellales bacterium]
MILTQNSLELLAPVGTWEVLEAAISAGADAVYLGGKRFNMRMHRTDVNFDDEMLERAIEYAHAHNVRLYVTVNNLISDHELEAMRSYLQLLEKLQPDALIVQDLAILELARNLKLTVPLHASVMMNTHNEYAVRTLQDYGITRVVANREMTLAQLALLKEKTGIEIEYFIHGDMCIAHSGQCIHSGVLFGQSSNRGRCLKPCRWPYQLVDGETGELISAEDPGPYKLALKDMCMYRNLPELIQAGVCSFKIEGRMRTADFVRKIVRVYRRAIDRYIADPTGYTIDENDWDELYNHRSRDFSTCYALGNPGANAIGYSGKREPRFFSQAVKEAGMPLSSTALPTASPQPDFHPTLAVRVANIQSLTAACQNGADIVYIAGEAFRPQKPWTLTKIQEAIREAANYQCQVVVSTPRVTMEQECGEYTQFFHALSRLQNKPQGLMLSNIGMLRLARQLSNVPVQTDFSLNVFNHVTVNWLMNNGASKATISPEASLEQVLALAARSPLPLEMIIHGPLEAMVVEHSLPAAILGHDVFDNSAALLDRPYALLDTAGQRHPIRIDQYGRNHILFAKDLCLLPYLSTLSGVTHFRIEGQHYSSSQVGAITAIYRQELTTIKGQAADYRFNSNSLDKLAAINPRELGIGAFRYRVSR